MMKDKVVSTIEKYNMLSGGERVVVGLSGGSDSMSLLYILCELRDKYGITVEAAHINHCLRGIDADNDENFVREQCEKLNIELHVLRADVKKTAEDNGMSLEEAGRYVRYGFFSSLGDDIVIATAHNLNDRIETFFFNFARGASLKGLCSTPPVRNNVIRPLIDCTKKEINSYCAQNDIPFVTDKTNEDVNYSRNRIRNNIVPEMRIINSAFESNASRCIDNVNEDDAFLQSLASGLLDESRIDNGYKIPILGGGSGPVLKRAVATIIKECGISPDYRMLDDVIAAINVYMISGVGRNIQLNDNLSLRTRAGILEIPSSYGNSTDGFALKPGTNIFNGFEITVSDVIKITDCSQIICNDVAVYLLDYDKITGNITVRSRMANDRISIRKRGITKVLRKLQNELGIPPEVRECCPVIADETGLIAAYMCGVDSRAAVDRNSEKIIKIVIEDSRSKENFNDR